ncbi:MAG: hypothetical protein LBV72_19785 [Tannerella sp.]|jgi:hypothetical protein|nr:hypothetical protein [Tannerella sp.]
MKTDLYTKAVLTVIALALICIVVQNFNPVISLYASEARTAPIMIPEVQEITSESVYITGHSLNRVDPIPVYVVDDPNKKNQW